MIKYLFKIYKLKKKKKTPKQISHLNLGLTHMGLGFRKAEPPLASQACIGNTATFISCASRRPLHMYVCVAVCVHVSLSLLCVAEPFGSSHQHPIVE